MFEYFSLFKKLCEMWLKKKAHIFNNFQKISFMVFHVEKKCQ